MSAGRICSRHEQCVGFVLDDASVRRAAVEGVPETVIAAIYLLHERSVGEVVSKLTPDELGHVIRLVGRCPSCYPPGTLDALKSKRMASLTPTAASLLPSADQRRGRCSSAPPTQTATSRAQRPGKAPQSGPSGQMQHRSQPDDLDARGRSPMCCQRTRPSLGGEAGGRSLGFISASFNPQANLRWSRSAVSPDASAIEAPSLGSPG